MRYCDGSAECESECFDYSTDLTKVQVTESSRHKHRFLVKAPLRSVDDLYVKKKSLYGAKAKYLQSIGQRACKSYHRHKPRSHLSPQLA